MCAKNVAMEGGTIKEHTLDHAGGACITFFAMCADNEQGVTIQGNLSMASSDESSRW